MEGLRVAHATPVFHPAPPFFRLRISASPTRARAVSAASSREIELRRVEFQGQSGATYSFVRLEGEASLRPIGVTYVIADATADAWRLLRVGHTNNLADKTWAAPLAQAREAHPSAELLVRLNVSRSLRESEAADLAASIN